MITRWQRSAFEKSAHHYAKVLGDTVCDSIAIEMELGRSDLVQGTLERIGQGSSQIRTLRIFDRQGQILRSVDSEEVGKRLDPTFLKSHLRDVSAVVEHQTYGEPVLSFIKPFLNRSQCQKCHDPNSSSTAAKIILCYYG